MERGYYILRGRSSGHAARTHNGGCERPREAEGFVVPTPIPNGLLRSRARFTRMASQSAPRLVVALRLPRVQYGRPRAASDTLENGREDVYMTVVLQTKFWACCGADDRRQKRRRLMEDTPTRKPWGTQSRPWTGRFASALHLDVQDDAQSAWDDVR